MRADHSSVAFTLDHHGHLYETGEDTVTARLDALLEKTPRKGLVMSTS